MYMCMHDYAFTTGNYQHLWDVQNKKHPSSEGSEAQHCSGDRNDVCSM